MSIFALHLIFWPAAFLESNCNGKVCDVWQSCCTAGGIKDDDPGQTDCVCAWVSFGEGGSERTGRCDEEGYGGGCCSVGNSNFLPVCLWAETSRQQLGWVCATVARFHTAAEARELGTGRESVSHVGVPKRCHSLPEARGRGEERRDAGAHLTLFTSTSSERTVTNHHHHPHCPTGTRHCAWTAGKRTNIYSLSLCVRPAVNSAECFERDRTSQAD